MKSEIKLCRRRGLRVGFSVDVSPFARSTSQRNGNRQCAAAFRHLLRAAVIKTKNIILHIQWNLFFVKILVNDKNNILITNRTRDVDVFCTNQKLWTLKLLTR